jgi:hypothetical protein
MSRDPATLAKPRVLLVHDCETSLMTKPVSAGELLRAVSHSLGA